MLLFPGWSPAWDTFLRLPSRALQNAGRGGMAHAQESAGTVSDRGGAVFHLPLGMSLAAQLPHRFDDLGHAAAVDRVIAAEPAAVGVERQLAHARNEIAAGDEFAAFAFLAEAEVLELHQHGDGKAVIDRGVLDVL